MAARRKSTSATTPAKKKRAKKGSKPVAADERALTRARPVSAFFKKNFGLVQKFDAKRPKKLAPKSELDAFAGLIRETSTAITAHPVAMKKTDAARASVAKQRGVVRELVLETRDLIEAQYPGDVALAGAYAGAGLRISAGVTQDVIAAASKQQQAFDSPEFGRQGRDAGLTAAQMAKLIVGRRALDKLASDQEAAETAQVAAAKKKQTLVASLRARTTHFEKAAKVIFKKNADVLHQLFPPVRRKTRGPTKKKSGQDPTPAAGGSATGGGA